MVVFSYSSPFSSVISCGVAVTERDRRLQSSGREHTDAARVMKFTTSASWTANFLESTMGKVLLTPLFMRIKSKWILIAEASVRSVKNV